MSKVSQECENKFRTLQGAKIHRVAALMSVKQDAMVDMGMAKTEDFKRLGQYHLMSAELVIADLLREIDDINAGRK